MNCVFLSLFTLFCTFFSELVYAELRVLPTRVQLSDKKRISLLSVKNESLESKKYEISLVFYKVLKDGTVQLQSDKLEKDRSAENMLRYSPRSVFLAPGEEQNVRIALSKNVNAADGEYRCHILFKPVNKTLVENPPKKELSFYLAPNVGVAVPVIISFGNIAKVGHFSDIKLMTKGAHNYLEFKLVKGSDRYFLMGDVIMQVVKDTSGEIIELARLNGINLYLNELVYRLQIPKESVSLMKSFKVKLTFKHSEPSLVNNDILFEDYIN